MINPNIDTMYVEVGTSRFKSEQESRPRSENLGMVATNKAKDFHLKKFLSDEARQMVQANESNNRKSTEPITYIVQKNVKPEEVRQM